MTELIIPSEAPALNELKERKLDHIARKAVLSLLNKIKHGRITIIEDHQRTPFGEKSPTASLQADVTVHHSQFYSRILFSGSIGAAEAYMERLWSTDDLTAVMRILAEPESLCRYGKGPGALHGAALQALSLCQKKYEGWQS